MLKTFTAIFILATLLAAPAYAAKMPETQRSQRAEARYAVPLENVLKQKSLELGNPVFLRITKTQSKKDTQGKLEAFVENDAGDFILFKTWNICTYSGELGPKLKQGDGQSPEGFYFVKPSQMNPYSSYHLSFNLGYPNAYDRAHDRTGDFLMVHGDCVSIGCYAMTDAGIEEIYTLVAAALKGGQPFVRVHACGAERRAAFCARPCFSLSDDRREFESPSTQSQYRFLEKSENGVGLVCRGEASAQCKCRSETLYFQRGSVTFC